MTNLRLLPLLALSTVALAQDTGVPAPVNPGFIVLVDQLDETADGDYYCADAWGSTVELGDGMQVHTCKYDRVAAAVDQTYTIDYPEVGNIYNTDGGFCAGSREIVAGAAIHLSTCNTRMSGQLWVSDSSGMIHPASDTSLCWAVKSGVHGLCGNPDCSNYKRTLTLQTCADVNSKYLIWTIPGGSVGL